MSTQTSARPHLRIVAVNDVYLLDHLPKLSTLRTECEAAHPDTKVLLTLAGDFLSPSMLSSLDGGRGMVDCLNHAGLTHAILGNHEDDLDVESLSARISELEAHLLSTNIFALTPPAPREDVITVQDDDGREVRVGLIGLCTLDPGLYRAPPFGGAPALPPADALRDAASRLLGQGRCDVLLPLTHLSVADDRALIEGAPVPLPLVLGGHDHHIVEEQVGDTLLLKAGADAHHAWVVDLRFVRSPAEDRVRTEVSARLVDVRAYADDPELKARTEAHLAPLRELERATLFIIPPVMTLSSRGTRAMQTSLGSFLTTRLRDILRADVCVINGGGIRGSRDHSGTFTYGDLKSEIPFDNEMTVVRIPGAVLSDAIAASRAMAPVERGAFLQVDDGVRLDPTSGRPTAVGGRPFDPSRPYAVALIRELLAGMDGIAPLADWARAHPDAVPPAGTGREVKQALVECFSRGMFAKLGGFGALDADRDGVVTAREIAVSIGRRTGEDTPDVAGRIIARAFDRNGDGVISLDEASAPERCDEDASA